MKLTNKSAKIIGVTGKSGAGKGFKIEKLARGEKNSYIIDADRVYHSMLKKNELKQSIISAFGHNIVDDEGNIDRKKLASAAFADKSSIEKLNRATHPFVAQEIVNLIEELEKKGIKTIYLDAPTLIESGLHNICDEIIFVKSPSDVRKNRIMARDRISEEQARQRMKFEKSDDFYLKYANKVIEN